MTSRGLGLFYLKHGNNWYLFSNIAWHDTSRIIVGWQPNFFTVDIRFCSSQVIHTLVTPLVGESFSTLLSMVKYPVI